MIDEIKNSLQFDNSNEPIFQFFPSTNDMSKTDKIFHDLNVNNPYGKISCLVLYLYSLELGSPPLYHEINRVCRTMDKRHMQSLGPYIKVLGTVTYSAEMSRDTEDKIMTGKMITKDE